MTEVQPATRSIRTEAPLDGHPGVARLTLDRPTALNALSFALLDELAAALETLDGDGVTRAVVLRPDRVGGAVGACWVTVS